MFAYADPDTMFGTYSWLYVQKRIHDYEMIEFEGRLVEAPEDSEGVVVLPVREIKRMPLVDWLLANGYVAIISR